MQEMNKRQEKDDAQQIEAKERKQPVMAYTKKLKF